MNDRDEPICMLGYYIEDKGIDSLPVYYPNLVKDDPTIRIALEHRALAERALLSRVDELVASADEDS